MSAAYSGHMMENYGILSSERALYNRKSDLVSQSLRRPFLQNTREDTLVSKDSENCCGKYAVKNAMNIYLVKSVRQPGFAELSGYGTWTDGALCKRCGYSSSKIIEPLLAAWAPGYDVMGDFSWSGYYPIVTDRVRDFAISQGFDVDFGQIEIVKSKTPARGDKRIKFPYQGPALHWMKTRMCVDANHEKSGLRIINDCDLCGDVTYRFRLFGLVIDDSELVGKNIFCINQYRRSKTMYMTEECFQAFSEQGFSNFHGVIVGESASD